MLGKLLKLVLRRERKAVQRHAKRRFLGSLLLLGAGYMLGVHRKVILAYIGGKELPPAPESHWWCRRRQSGGADERITA